MRVEMMILPSTQPGGRPNGEVPTGAPFYPGMKRYPPTVFIASFKVRAKSTILLPKAARSTLQELTPYLTILV
ncbi:hypothetical protein VTK56DRAFT_10129 [Thermocarpiscus australiensis]